MEKKVTIGMCSGGTVRVETVTSLVSNLINIANTGLAPNLLFQVGGYVDINRNKLVEHAIANEATHLMFIDADMIFPEDGVMRLLAHDKDIVGANYNVRLGPTSKELSGPTTKMLVDGKPVTMLAEGFPTELFKCYAIATGFMLINLRIFDRKYKKLKKPYFDAWIDKDNRHYTEDIDFCRKAGELGIEVWCDPTLELGHVGSYTY